MKFQVCTEVFKDLATEWQVIKAGTGNDTKRNETKRNETKRNETKLETTPYNEHMHCFSLQQHYSLVPRPSHPSHGLSQY